MLKTSLTPPEVTSDQKYVRLLQTNYERRCSGISHQLSQRTFNTKKWKPLTPHHVIVPFRFRRYPAKKKTEPRMSINFFKTQFFLPFLVPSYVSLYLLHHYSGEQSHVWKRKKENHLNSGDPEESEQNPEVRSKLTLRALPLAAYLVNISTTSLLSKHVNRCLCTLDWPAKQELRLYLCFFFFFFTFSCLSLPSHST